jgi:hypothetical protein
LNYALYQLIIFFALLIWWASSRMTSFEHPEKKQAQHGDHVDALAQLYIKARASSHIAGLLAWDLKQKLSLSVGRRTLKDPLLIIAKLRERGFEKAQDVPLLLQNLEKIAHESQNVDENLLIEYAAQIDELHERLNRKEKSYDATR